MTNRKKRVIISVGKDDRMTRFQKLDTLVKNYRNGIWVTKDGTKKRISAMDDTAIKGIVYHLKNYAIASLHYDIFGMSDNGMRNDLLKRYDEDFDSLVKSKLSAHPVWKHIQREIDKRNLTVVI